MRGFALALLLPHLLLGQWVQTSDLSDFMTYTSAPQVVVDAGRQGVAIWIVDAVGVQGAKLPPPGIIWSDPVDVSVPLTTGRIPQTALVVDPCCTATAIWEEALSPSESLLQSARSKGCESGWSGLILQRASDVPIEGNSLQLGVDACGNVLALWNDVPAFKVKILKSSWLCCGCSTWTEPIVLSGGSNLFTPHLAVNCAGKAIAVWALADAVQSSVLYPGASSWEPTLNDPSPPSETVNSSPKVAIDDCGAAVAVFVSDGTILGATLANGSTLWIPTSTASTSPLNSNPQVVKDCRGNAFAIWVDETNGALLTAELPAESSTWSAPQTIATGAITLPRLAIDRLGNLVAAWVEMGNTVRGAVKPFGRPFGLPTTFVVGQPVDFLSLAVSPDGGKAIALWSGPQGIVFGEAGFNLFPPLPPLSLVAEQGENNFASQVEVYNRLFWRASPSCAVASYKVYRQGKEIGTVSAGKNLVFTDRNQKKGSLVTYEVTAVGATGLESLPIAATVTVGKGC